MARQKKGPLTLSQLRKGTLFKVTRPHQIGTVSLTLDGVYSIGTAKADHGQNVKVNDLAFLRPIRGGGFGYGSALTIPIREAERIEVYTLPPN